MLARGSAVLREPASGGARPGGGDVRRRGARLLEAADLAPAAATDAMDEARREIPGAGRGAVRVIVLDSNGLVGPGDEGHVVVTGSHGGLLGAGRRPP
jgi:hypothetical protein